MHFIVCFPLPLHLGFAAAGSSKTELCRTAESGSPVGFLRSAVLQPGENLWFSRGVLLYTAVNMEGVNQDFLATSEFTHLKK